MDDVDISCGFEVPASGDGKDGAPVILGGAVCGTALNPAIEYGKQVCGNNVGLDTTLLPNRGRCCGPKGYQTGPDAPSSICCSKKFGPPGSGAKPEGLAWGPPCA